jgi:hypothetical protein
MIEIKNKRKQFHISMIFFVCVVLLTSTLYAYNMYIADSNTEIENKIVKLDMQIVEVKKNRWVLVSTLLLANKKLLETMEKRNEIDSFISHMDIMEKKYNVEFNWFTYEDGNISTLATFESKKSDITDKVGFSETLAYQDSVKFIREYRKSTKVPFTLEFINSITGTDNITFNIGLTLK